MIEQGINGLYSVRLNEYEVELGFLTLEDALEYLFTLED